MERLNLLDYRAAAQYLGLSEYTLRRYVSRKLVPHVKLGLKLVRFKPETLRAWLEEHSVLPADRIERPVSVRRTPDPKNAS